jgi:outer membrane protein TolC
MKRYAWLLPALALLGQAGFAAPLTLPDAVAMALTVNPSVHGAAADAEAAREEVGAAKAEGRPKVSATRYLSTGTMGSIRNSPPNVMPQNIYAVPATGHADVDLMAMAPLSTGGRVAARTRGAKASARAAAGDLRAARADVALGVRLAWRGWQLAGARRDIAEDTLKASNERLRVAEERYKVGSAALLEVLRARTEQAEARQAVTDAGRDVETARLDLQAAIGTQEALPPLSSEPLAYTPPVTTEAADVAAGLEDAPEILAARSRAEAGRAGVGAAEAAYRPQVSGVVMTDAWGTRGEGGNSGYAIGIVVGLPLVDGGMRKAEVAASEARRAHLESDLDAVQVRVRHDVAVAWATVRAAEANIAASEAAVAEAEEGYRVMNQRYQAGKALLVEVLDALAARTRAQTRRVEAVYQAAVATDRLDRAVGRGSGGTETTTSDGARS